METSVPAPCLRQYDTEDDLLRDYWRRGYQYSEISLFLSQFHNVHLKFEAMTDITSSSGRMRLDVPPDAMEYRIMMLLPEALAAIYHIMKGTVTMEEARDYIRKAGCWEYL
ncbi:uncharacterized protein LOC144911792 [Branchiostoma floridae x Branchiostoma belcheri]